MWNLHIFQNDEEKFTVAMLRAEENIQLQAKIADLQERIKNLEKECDELEQKLKEAESKPPQRNRTNTHVKQAPTVADEVDRQYWGKQVGNLGDFQDKKVGTYRELEKITTHEDTVHLNSSSYC